MTPIQAERLKAWRDNDESFTQTANILNISRSALTASVKKALEYELASPGQLEAIKNTGLDLNAATHGWRVIVQPDGSRDSVFWKTERVDVEPVDVIKALTDSLQTFPKLSTIKPPTNLPKDLCNFIPLCDLHVGSEYGDPDYLAEVYRAIDRLLANLPKAKKAVLLDMGDLLDANDHKGLTPASENNCDVIRENHLQNTIDALGIMRYTITRLAESHEEVEVHLLRGNHDETAYIAVMVALDVHFTHTTHVNIIVTDDDFRVIPWGKCAVFPHHGDKTKWENLKDVFADQFPTAWAEAKYWRFIWTAHVHHDKQKQLVGADCEHFRTLAKPNKWAQQKGFFTRGGICGITLHKEHGEVDRKKVNLKPLLLEDR